MDAFERAREQHRLWKLRPEFANLRIYDQLFMNEFRPPEEQQALVARAVRGIAAYAAANSPYYNALFGRLGLAANAIEGPDDLARLPTLTKHDVLEHFEEMWVRQLPQGETLFGHTKSSGTTGRPVKVMHTARSARMFMLLRHRTSRWFELDPREARLDVRPRSDLFRAHTRDNPIPDGALARLPTWQGLGRHFHTGPEFGFTMSTPMEQQVELLRKARPAYATSFPGVFEEWLLAASGRKPVDSLRGLVGIGAQLTPSLRARLEESYAAPVHMSYGLNEIGKVATRCREGRYHVNSEHCLVQIVREDGKPCGPGEVGHLLVTGLNNAAMPLLRYNTGDLAEVTEGPCPCGRTLASFGEIAGRYRSYAGLPPLSRERVRAVRVAVEGYPPEKLSAFLRRYQLHQDLQDRFTLRLRTVAAVPAEFRDHVLRAWEPVLGTPPSPLSIAVVDEIAASPGGKLIDFVSDFHTDSSLPLEQRAATQAGA